MEETWYDKEEDILKIILKKGTYWKSIELSDGVVMDIAKDGSLLAIEIRGASKIFNGTNKKVIEHAKLISSPLQS